jgi:hypothetical protein
VTQHYDTYSMGPDLDIAQTDLVELGHLLPPSGLELVRTIGPRAAVALMRGLPGVQLVVPKHEHANPAGARRWAQLAEIVGAPQMPGLAAIYGGGLLDVPSCKALINEKRNRWLRRRFDELTTRPVEPIAAEPSSIPPMSKRQAVFELGLELAGARRGLTYRQIERLIDSADTPAVHPQLSLFATAVA